MSGGRIACLDVGLRRIGIAMSTPDARIALPHAILTIPRASAGARGSAAQFAARHVETVFQTKNVFRCVVGDPINAQNGAMSRHVHATVDAMRCASQFLAHRVEWVFWDERFSSVQADRIVTAVGKDIRNHHNDDVAASLVLDSYLQFLVTTSHVKS
eukprot:ANDGO_03372.mRNA.1 hypothetical protein